MARKFFLLVVLGLHLGTTPAFAQEAAIGPFPFMVVYSQTGGFAGVHLEATIDLGYRILSLKKSRKELAKSTVLAAEDLQTLQRRLSAILFDRLKKSYRCERCRDQFSYKLNVKKMDREHSVSWQDQSGAPKALFDFRDEVSRLIGKYFPTRG